MTCIQDRQSIIDGFTRASSFFHNHIVREEEALVDLWAGCHVFSQAWIMQGSILWSRWKERVWERGRKKDWDIKTVFKGEVCNFLNVKNTITVYCDFLKSVNTGAFQHCSFVWAIWHQLNHVTEKQQKRKIEKHYYNNKKKDILNQASLYILVKL